MRLSRMSIPQANPARAILSAQYPQGYWMRPGIGYSPRYRATIWQVLILAQLGIDRCEALDRAVMHLCRANQRSDGAFRASREEDDSPIGLNASILWALGTLGYEDTPQVAKAWSWLVQEVEDLEAEPTLAREMSEPSALVKVVWAANARSRRSRDAAVEDARRFAACWLLRLLPGLLQQDPQWLQLTFPLTLVSDLLHWFEVLKAAGYGGEPPVCAARRKLLHKRQSDGEWPLERDPGKLWTDFGEMNEASKWITIRALAAGL